MIVLGEQEITLLLGIEVQHHPAHGDYVRLYDIPQPWRDVFFAFVLQREPAELPYIWSEDGPHERGWLWQEWLSLLQSTTVAPLTPTVQHLDDDYLEGWRAKREETQNARRNMCMLRPRNS